jgi:hypothetical protein
MCELMERPVPPGVNAGRVTVGVIILTLGVLMLVDRAAYFDFNAVLLFPGVVLIAMGLVRMALAAQDAGAHRGPRPIVHGLWLMTVGTWLILNLLHLFGMRFQTSWPLLMIAGGVFIVARAWER